MNIQERVVPVSNVPNVLFEHLPETWNGYQINWNFQIGIQIFLASEDKELMSFEKSDIIIELLFPSEIPPAEHAQECISWYLNGWVHDRSPKESEKRKLLDFNKDQWRIYSDFRQIYGINLNEADDLHWWEFMGMLWNMPYKQSSFLQVIDIRKKKIKAKMSSEEIKAIKEAQYIYALDDNLEKERRSFSEEEKQKIDDFDQIREQMMKKKQMEKETRLCQRGGMNN